jgi:hypothetical protein
LQALNLKKLFLAQAKISNLDKGNQEKVTTETSKLLPMWYDMMDEQFES